MYSFSMILYQLFEHTPPFAGVDPVEAARQAALYDKRPNLMQLGEQRPFPMGVSSAAPAAHALDVPPCLAAHKEGRRRRLLCRRETPHVWYHGRA